MIAIVETEPSPSNKVLSVRFSTDIVEVKSENIHIINLKEGSLSVNALAMLMNNPQGLTAYDSLNVSSSREDIGPCIIGLPSIPQTLDIGPFARELDSAEKSSLSVRPAAHRAGQTSFFGNL